jgi:membrane protease YdiL (CAAX protease family)
MSSYDPPPGRYDDEPREGFTAHLPPSDPGGPDYPHPEHDELPPPGKPHPNIAWAILWTIGFIIFSQIIGALIGIIFGIIVLVLQGNFDNFMKLINNPEEMQKSEEFATIMWPAMIVVESFTIIYGWAALRIISGRTWPRKVALRLPSLPHTVLILILVPGFVLTAEGVSLATKTYLPNLPSFGNLDTLGFMITHWPWWLGVLLIGLGPGIGEELFCRAFLGRGLVGTHGYILGVIFTSLLFGCMHLEPQQVIYATVLGLLLHFVYLTTRSLLLPMLLHTINNSISVLAAWADGNQCAPDWLNAVQGANGKPAFLWVYAGAVILTLAVCIGLYFSRARLCAADGSSLVPWQPPYPNVEYPPAGSGTVVVRPLVPGLVAVCLGLLGFLAFVACCFVTYLQLK